MMIDCLHERNMEPQRARLGCCAVLLMLLLCSWTQGLSNLGSIEEFDFTYSRDEGAATFNDIAVPGGFEQTEYMDYDDVAILINNQSAASRTIGWAFINARNISMNNVLIFNNSDTPTSETINRNQFNTYFVEPMMDWLNQSQHRSKEINYLVTTKGIPLRVSGGNNKVSFDNEIALVEGDYKAGIDQDWWIEHNYGPLNGGIYESFSREEHGFYLVTRLTGYTVETALGLIEKANNSLGQRGNFVLDLASNRNESGYKFWNDDLYAANTSLNDTMGLPVIFNQNSTFLTNISNIIAYASWGSNDGEWNRNQLSNGGFDTLDESWSSGSRHWNVSSPSVSGADGFEWMYQTETKQGGNGAQEAKISSQCTQESGYMLQGMHAEYFDNEGISFNTASMPDLIDRIPDHARIESSLAYSSSYNAYPGLDDRFKNNWGARFSGLIEIPETGNWTFYLNSDDGSELWINGVSAIQNYGSHGMREFSSSMNLTSGMHDFKVEFFQGGGPHGLIVSWQGPNVSKSHVPASAFFVANDAIPQSEDLIHAWDFEEGAGSQSNNSVDDSHFTLYGMNSSNWRTCIDGNCLWFDGDDDRAEVEVDDWTGNFSISQWVWANSTNQTTYASTFAIDDNAGSNGSFQHMISGGVWKFHNNQTKDFGAVEAQKWTHLVSVFEAGEVRQYMDGVLVQSNAYSNGSINNFDLYKLGVNRAGNSFFEGMIDKVMIWNNSLSNASVTVLNRDIVNNCSAYSGSGQGVASLETIHDIPEDFTGHVWNIFVYGRRSGDVYGEYSIEVSSLDSDGNVFHTNTSSNQAFTATSWSSTSMRFRPHADATSLRIRVILDIVSTSSDGSLFIDSAVLRIIRPHMGWENGSIAETAVSTGARSFNWGTTYGQSLVADLLEDGVSGVKGYVYEPYLTAVAYPSVMTTAYANGYTWAESIYMANPLMSWMGVAVGDPKMAAFADILHDVNISDIMANETPTKNRTSVLEVLIENLAPSAGVGVLEVRERQGNALVGMVNLTLPAGDQPGSRTLVQVNIMPQRTGFTEFVVKWVNASGYNERIKNNNVMIINLLVNEAPSVTDAYCQSDIIYRGSSFTCSVQAEDDREVVAVQIGWRIQDGEGNWSEATMVSAGSSDNSTWWTGVSIPSNSSLGELELIVIALDDQGYDSGLLRFTNVTQVIDAVANWYGPHIEGIDADDWPGIGQLSFNANGLKRAATSQIKACVLDADHDFETQQPIFYSSSGTIGNTSMEETNTPDLTCYVTNLSVPSGGDLAAIEIGFMLDDGSSIYRNVIPGDEVPVPVLELRDSNNQSLDFASGSVGESIWVELNDRDDPLSSAYGDLKVRWPGHVERIASVDISQGESGVLVELPYPQDSLELGDIEVELSLRAAHSAQVEISETWPVLLTSPVGLGIELCDMEGQSIDGLVRGHQSIATLYVQSHRPVANTFASLSQSGWSVSPTPLQDEDHSGKCLNEIENATYIERFRVIADSSFVEGEVTLTITFNDIDGLMVRESVELNVVRSRPEVNLSAPESVLVGEKLRVEVMVKDLDGVQGTQCTFTLKDRESREVFSHSMLIEVQDEMYGSTTFSYPTPAKNSSVNQPPWQVSVACTDSDGDSSEAILNHTVDAEFPPPCTENCEEKDASKEQQASTGFSSQETLMVSVAGVLILLAVLSFLFLRKRKEEEIIDPWSQRDDSQSAVSQGEIVEHQNILQEEVEVEPSEFSDVLADII
ncbi:MAG: hypothetical protein CMB49_06075 [Euryarchaeota archaeon]|nr:hypothetical protein [Euryarchaeota archaeon]